MAKKKQHKEAVMWLVSALVITAVGAGVAYFLTGGKCSTTSCNKAAWKAGCKKRCDKKKEKFDPSTRRFLVFPSIKDSGQFVVANPAANQSAVNLDFPADNQNNLPRCPLVSAPGGGTVQAHWCKDNGLQSIVL